MRAKTLHASRFLLVAAALAVVLALPLTTGCSLLGGGEAELVSVADNTGFYHVKVPSDWVTRVDPGMISMYAAESLPEGEVLTDPVAIIFLSEVPMEEPLAESLVTLVGQRAESREWADTADIGEPFETEIGGREAAGLHVEATDTNGIDFQGEFFLIRTAGREVLLMALAPTAQWSDFAPQLESLQTEWYWHIPHDMGSETSETVEATE